MNKNDFECPNGLSETGRKAYDIISSFLRDNKLDFTGGCKLFYSPEEWRDRGEEYGTESELIICYDGAAAKQALSYDGAYNAGSYEMLEQLQDKLEESGLFFECCMVWYSAVYKI